MTTHSHEASFIISSLLTSTS